ncbi:hypothetical protein [Bradyrhizobium sp. ORS 86]|uniref:hypothetical protein n=1 Tax=Bradyrhizobium sp. ORS 86 TaxID=1685970 RepID=UPI00389105AC
MFIMFFLCLLALLAVWVLVPLIPAVLIYNRFPNAPLVANGPLAGLTINTGGAFAAYLIILLVITPLVFSAKDYIHEATRPYWEIRGELVLLDETGNPIQVLDNVLDRMDVRTHDPNILGHDGTTLSFKIPEADDGSLPSSIEISFPDSNFKAQKSIPLRQQASSGWKFWKWFDQTDTTETRDIFRKRINVGKVIIRPVPTPQAYNSTQGMDKPKLATQ